MPTITSVLKRRDRARVFVDDEFWAELDPQVAAECGLQEGAVFSREELAEARVMGERPLAMNRALGALGYRARSKSELHRRLIQAGYAEAAVGEVIGRLEELGYLDDEEFAQELVRVEARKYGPRRIHQDLLRAGVDEELVHKIVEKEFAENSEHQMAIETARRRYNTGEDPDAQARRVYGFLMRRGYSASVSAEVAREYRQETDE